MDTAAYADITRVSWRSKQADAVQTRRTSGHSVSTRAIRGLTHREQDERPAEFEWSYTYDEDMLVCVDGRARLTKASPHATILASLEPSVRAGVRIVPRGAAEASSLRVRTWDAHGIRNVSSNAIHTRRNCDAPGPGARPA